MEPLSGSVAAGAVVSVVAGAVLSDAAGWVVVVGSAGLAQAERIAARIKKSAASLRFMGNSPFHTEKVVLSIENACVFWLYSIVSLSFCQVLFEIKIIFTKKVPEETFFRDKSYIFSASSSQRRAEASLGIRQSPRGLRHTEPTFTPSGRQLRLNCWEKNRR